MVNLGVDMRMNESVNGFLSPIQNVSLFLPYDSWDRLHPSKTPNFKVLKFCIIRDAVTLSDRLRAGHLTQVTQVSLISSYMFLCHAAILSVDVQLSPEGVREVVSLS